MFPSLLDGKLQKTGRQQTLIDASLGLTADNLQLVDVNAGGFRLKKGQGIERPTQSVSCKNSQRESERLTSGEVRLPLGNCWIVLKIHSSRSFCEVAGELLEAWGTLLRSLG